MQKPADDTREIRFVPFEPLELHTEHLMLRAVQESDAPELYPHVNDDAVAAGMLRMPHPFPEDGLTRWIKRIRESMALFEQYEFAIVLKETGHPIGLCRLRDISKEHLNADIGYWLGRKHWGRGYMTEAVQSIIKFGFEDLGLERISACCFFDNFASARVLEKSGMKRERYARHYFLKQEQFLDVLHYAIIRSDYLDEGFSGPSGTDGRHGGRPLR